ncbi:hypothetical protein TWF718_010277 [Orbilia javanica]|uniref:F-box domain-containing protein n=1 Tax=Orbilia javanica TaxID=47235 RepID=A0AAN8MHS2_9PEZI
MSLITLPPELLNLITSPLTLHDLLKLRLINKPHNLKFQHFLRTELFTHIHLHLPQSSPRTSPKSLKTLTLLPPSARTYITTITITSNHHPNTNTTATPTPLRKHHLKLALSTLPSLTTITIETTTPSHLTALLKSLPVSTTTTSLRHCHCICPGISLSDVTLPSSSSSITHPVTSLRTLHLTVRIPNNPYNYKLTRSLWKYISTAFPGLESLVVRNTSQIPTDPSTPWPLSNTSNSNNTNNNSNSNKSNKSNKTTFLPKQFTLHNLKTLELYNIYLTPQDITTSLLPVDSKIESIHLEACHLNVPYIDWVDVIYHIFGRQSQSQPNLPHLTSLNLSLSGYHRGIASYELPEIIYTSTTHPLSQITLPICQIPPPLSQTTLPLLLTNPPESPPETSYIFHKDLQKILTPNRPTPSSFWSYLTDDLWNSPKVTKWKRIRLLADQYDLDLKKLSAYAHYDYQTADRLERKFNADLDRIELEAQTLDSDD